MPVVTAAEPRWPSTSHDVLDGAALVDIVQGDCLDAASSLETALNRYFVAASLGTTAATRTTTALQAASIPAAKKLVCRYAAD